MAEHWPHGPHSVQAEHGPGLQSSDSVAGPDPHSGGEDRYLMDESHKLMQRLIDLVIVTCANSFSSVRLLRSLDGVIAGGLVILRL